MVVYRGDPAVLLGAAQGRREQTHCWKWLTFAGTSGATKVGLSGSPGPQRHRDFLGVLHVTGRIV